MPDISKITLLDGGQYNFKDSTARSGLDNKQGKVKTATATLTVAGWSNDIQTVSVTGVTANNHVIVSYAPTSKDAYTSADIYCSSQAAGQLTFSCASAPSEAVSVNIIIID